MQPCPQCGFENKVGAPVCAGCGRALPTVEKASSKETASPPASYPPPVAHKTSALAVCSLVLGILSMALCVVGLFFALPGILCGTAALRRIKSSGGALRGRGLAMGGLVTGCLGILLCLAVILPNISSSSTTSRMNACISNLRLIDMAKQQWALDHKKQATDTPTMQDLQTYWGRGSAGVPPTCPAGGVYILGAVGQKPTCNIPGHALP